jgi:hypothetical protein
MARTRPPTDPARPFHADDLAQLGREQRRRLVQLLAREAGLSFVAHEPFPEYDDLVFGSEGFARPRRLLLRVMTREAAGADLEALEEQARATGLAEAILVLTSPGEAPAAGPQTVAHAIDADSLIGRLEDSALVGWESGKPDVLTAAFAAWEAVEKQAVTLDPVGIRWLTTLGANKRPAGLSDAPSTVDVLLEQVAFRLLTTVFRFGGWRLGAAERGEPLPDAVLLSPAGAPTKHAALLDCKARRGGFTMTKADERALCEYVGTLREQAEARGHPLRYVVILSSSFPGSDDRRHPYFGRARALKGVDVQLAYITAAGLVRLALEVERRDLTPADREALPWPDALDQGRVQTKDLEALLPTEDAA